MSYVTGSAIRELQEKRKLTQRELAEAEACDEEHQICVEDVDDEHCVTIRHPMDKKHDISFLAYVTSGSFEVVKLYPQQDISVRFRKNGHGAIYAFCNRHGMFRRVMRGTVTIRCTI